MTEVKMAFPDLRHPFAKQDPATHSGATVIYNERIIEVTELLDAPGLWVTPSDLTRINGFELKPQGACFEELCIPVKEGGDLLISEAGKQWFNLEAFAVLLQQAYVVDTDTNTYSFGEIPAKRQSLLENAMAPDFELTDREGKVIRMADYKGKKALIITWSSW